MPNRVAYYQSLMWKQNDVQCALDKAVLKARLHLFV